MRYSLTRVILFSLLLLSTISCQRRGFSDRTTKVLLHISIETEIKNSQKVETPELMRVNLYSSLTGNLVYTDYVGPQGGYIYPPPGQYDMLVYNIGTESTIIRNENEVHAIEAYTNELSSFQQAQISKLQNDSNPTASGQEVIINEPDHLFVGRSQDLEIPSVPLNGEEVHIVLEVKAESVVETWKVDVIDVKGLEWVSSVEALISAQVRSRFIAENVESDGVASIFFTMEKDEANDMLTGRFNTFGKHPLHHANLSLNINIIDNYGGEHRFNFDINDQFDDNDDFYLFIIGDIEIEEPKVEGGGFDPKVDDWNNINKEITL